MTLKMNKQKESYVSQTQSKSHEKKLSTIENQLKVLNQEMSASRMKSTFLIGLFMIIMMSALGTEFQGNELISISKFRYRCCSSSIRTILISQRNDT